MAKIQDQQPQEEQEQEQPVQKEGQRLILMDGTIIEDGRCGYADAHLWCWITGYTMQQAAAIFFDPGKTGKIVYEYGEMSKEYNGFTTCTNLFIDSDGQISVCLVKGVA